MEIKPDSLPVHILLAEDDNDDQLLFTEALSSLALPFYQLTTVNDGEECINFLTKQGRFKTDTRTVPDFIVLDINMPKLDGLAVLKKFKEITSIQNVPVFILSTTGETETCAICQALGCAAYYRKPPALDDLKAILADMYERYLVIKTLPRLK